MSIERNVAQRTQRVVHQLAERINQCGQVANELSDIIDDLACGPSLAVEVEGGSEVSWGLSAAEIRPLTEAALNASAEIRRRVTVGGFWTDQVEQVALLRWLVKTLLVADPRREPVQIPTAD